ncbi:MAG: hypothetical protein EG825_09925 [Rhodocyclaceae bacterium]|nr:hypothetical protein [Rhodocyclaceae bacterium]
MPRLAAALILVLATLPSLAAPPAPKEAPVEIVSAEFGVFEPGAKDELVFEPASIIPHRLGQRYGWIIELRTARRSVSVREEYLLPEAPKAKETSVPGRETLEIPSQRRHQVSQRQLVPVEGKIYGEWSIGPNEPAGHRQLQVVVEGEVAASFGYDVK